MKTIKALILVCVICAARGALAQSTIPKQINYQGLLQDVNGSNFVTGSTNLSFKVYSAATAGTLLWGPEIFDGSNGIGHSPPVTIVSGQFNVLLGDQDTNGASLAAALIGQPTALYYIELTVGTNSPISPRQQILSAPFAVSAANSEKLGGYAWSDWFTTTNPATGVLVGSNRISITGAQIAPGSITGGQIGAGTIASSNLASNIGMWSTSGSNVYYTNGNVGIGTNNPGAALQVMSGGVAIGGDGSPYTGKGIFLNSTAASGNIFAYDYTLGTPRPLSLQNPGGNVGIGTTNPQAPLEIAAPITGEVLRFGHNSAGGDYHNISAGYHGSISSLDYLQFNLESSSFNIKPVMTLVGNGNVGIGTTSPGDLLTINGSGSLGVTYQQQIFTGAYSLNLGVSSSGGEVQSVGAIPLYLNHRGNNIVMADAGAGNVGIGTASPAYPLDIASSGQAVIRVLSGNGGSGGSVLELRNMTSGNVALGAINFNSLGNSFPGQISYTADGNMHFRVVNVDNMMVLNQNGLTVNGTFVSSSDRNAKENFKPVQPKEILGKVMKLPVSRWNFKQDSSSEHIGPMAQDFYAAFGLGADNRHIATLDEDGVALAAIQGLNEIVKEKEAKITNLESDISKLKTEQSHANLDMEARLKTLEEAITRLSAAGKDNSKGVEQEGGAIK